MNFYKDMSIELYLRNFVYLKILKFLDKTSCAKCCSKDNLCIHHNKELEFSTMLYKSLEDLNIEYKERYMSAYCGCNCQSNCECNMVCNCNVQVTFFDRQNNLGMWFT